MTDGPIPNANAEGAGRLEPPENSRGPEERGDSALSPLIFLSYGRNNSREAGELRAMLIESDFRVWMAPDDIRGPRPWAEQILDAIADAAMMVVLVSSDSNSSTHVGREVSLAFEQGKAVLPIRVEDVVVSGILEYQLSIIQKIDAFPPPLTAHRENLIRGVADRLNVSRNPEPGRSRPPDPRRGPRVDATVLWSLLAGGAVVLVATFLLRPTPEPGPTTTSTQPTSTSTSTTTTTSSTEATDPQVSFRAFTDDSGRLRVDVPSSWDVQGTPSEVDGTEIGPGLTVSPDIEAFRDGWDTPGVFVFASKILFDEYGTAEAYLNSLASYEPCDDVDRRAYRDSKYVGVADYSSGCGGIGASAFKLVALPITDPDYLIGVFYKAESGDDSEIRGSVLESFNFDGEFDSPTG